MDFFKLLLYMAETGGGAKSLFIICCCLFYWCATFFRYLGWYIVEPVHFYTYISSLPGGKWFAEALNTAAEGLGCDDCPDKPARDVIEAEQKEESAGVSPMDAVIGSLILGGAAFGTYKGVAGVKRIRARAKVRARVKGVKAKFKIGALTGNIPTRNVDDVLGLARRATRFSDEAASVARLGAKVIT